MNRRDFFKLAGLGISGLLAPKWAEERFGDEMQIGDLLAKLGRGETLTSAEQGRIRLWGNNTEFNNAYIAGLQNGSSDINAKIVRAEFGEFSVPPVSGFVVVGGGNLSVALSTWVYINFSLVRNSTNVSAFSVGSDNTELLIRNRARSIGSTYIVLGFANWLATYNAVVRLFQYDSSDAIIAASTLSYLTSNEQPFCGSVNIEDDCTYVRVGVNQSTASPATLQSLEMSIFEII